MKTNWIAICGKKKRTWRTPEPVCLERAWALARLRFGNVKNVW